MQHLNTKVIWLFFFKNVLINMIFLPLWYFARLAVDSLLTPNLGALETGKVLSTVDTFGTTLLIILIIGAFISAWINYYSYTYEVATDGFHLQHGIIFRTNLVIAYDHIQNAQVNINPVIFKLFNLHALTLTTVSSHNTEEKEVRSKTRTIPGLSPEVAGQLRDQLIINSHAQSEKKTFTPTDI